MHRVCVGVDEADRDGVDTLVEETPYRASRVVAIERAHHLARRVHALVHHHPQVALHERRRFLPGEVVEPRHPQVAKVQHIAEALAGDEPDVRPGELENRVGCHGGAVHDLRDGVRRHLVLGEHRLQPSTMASA